MQKKEQEQIKCEIYSRCCGYYRPTRNFNVGAKAQHDTRHFHKVKNTSAKTNLK